MTRQRRRVKQTRSLEERMAEQAASLREQALQQPVGAERESLLRRATIADAGGQISNWLRSAGPQPPK
nr:hypothetical protein [Bradyrhizobium sp. CW7]